LDPDIKNISKEATIAITKATELFVAYLTVRSNTINNKRKGKVIRDVDLYQTIHTTELLQFLRIDFPRSVVTNAQEKAAQQHANIIAIKAAAAPVGVPSIKSFFFQTQSELQSMKALAPVDDVGDGGDEGDMIH